VGVDTSGRIGDMSVFAIQMERPNGTYRFVRVSGLENGAEAFYVGRAIADALNLTYYMHIEEGGGKMNSVGEAQR